jgi:DNA gyrase/topoisomerase IV subunit A
VWFLDDGAQWNLSQVRDLWQHDGLLIKRYSIYMSLIDHDLPWLATEAGNDPETAQRIIAALAERVQVLQRQADELRAENALLKRTGGQQTSTEQVQRLKTNLRDLRQVAARKGLDRDVVSMVSFSGQGMHLPAPAPFEQTLNLLAPAEEPLSMVKPVYLATGTWFGALLAITSNVRLLLVSGLGLPVSERLDWRDARRLTALGLARAERVEAICALDELRPPRDVLLVSRQGWVRAISWMHVETVVFSGQALTLPGTGDTPVWIGACDTDADLLLLTRNGRWTRFPIGMIPSTGCAGITLDPGDDVVSAVVLGKEDAVVWFCGADGTLCAIASDGLIAHKRPGGKPVPLARRFMALTCFGISARKTEVVLLLSNQGDMHVVSMQGLPIAAKPAETQPLKAASQRLLAATLLKQR